MNRFINKVFNGDALDLLRVIPTASIDDVIADAMYGTANCRGTGSTLVGATQLSRLWIGCYRSRRYCQVAMKRLAELAKKRIA